MNKKKICLCFLFILLNCFVFSKTKQNKGKLPTWINEPYSVYQTGYFVAVGSDKIKNIAELNAVSELAGILSRDVKSNMVANSSMTQKEEDNISSLISEQNLNQQITVNIDQRNLIGIEILETFFDDNKEQWYALAVLDKQKAEKIYSKEIEASYKNINQNYNESKNKTNNFDKLRYLYKCKKEAQYVQSLIVRLQVINFEAAETIQRTDISESKFYIEFNNIASKIPISIQVNNDLNNEIKIACSDVFESYGFKIQEQANNVLSVDLENNFRTVYDPDAVYCESNVAIRLNLSGEQIVFPFNYTNRAAGKNQELAQKKEYNNLSTIIKSEYKKLIENILLQ